MFGKPSYQHCHQVLFSLAAHEEQLTELYAEIGKLTTQITWLKKKLQL